MAEIRIPTDEFERGIASNRCALSGEPANARMKAAYKSRIGAKWLLLLLGVLPFVVVWAITRRTARGDLPVSRVAFGEAKEQGRRRDKAGGRCLALAVLCALVVGLTALFLDAPAGLWAAGPITALGAVAYLWLNFTGHTLIPGYVEPSGRWVVLTDVADAFASDVNRSPASKQGENDA